MIWLESLGVYAVKSLALSTPLLGWSLVARRWHSAPSSRCALAWGTVLALAMLAVGLAWTDRPRVAWSPPLAADWLSTIDASAGFDRPATDRKQGTVATLDADAPPANRFSHPQSSIDASHTVAQTSWIRTGLACVGGAFLLLAVGLCGQLALGRLLVDRLRKRAARPDEALREAISRSFGRSIGRTEVAITRDLDSPAALGVWRPAILLPRSMNASETQPAALSAIAHELAHIRNGDVVLRLLERLLSITFALQPLFWRWSRGVRQDLELRADREAAGEDPFAYAESLVEWAKLHERSRSTRRLERLTGSVGWNSVSKEFLERRMVMILSLSRGEAPRRGSRWTALSVCASLLALAIGACGVGLAAPPSTMSAEAIAAAKIGKTVDVKGVAVDEKDRPIADAAAELWLIDGFTQPATALKEATAKTDAMGEFRFPGTVIPASDSTRRLERLVIVRAPGRHERYCDLSDSIDENLPPEMRPHSLRFSFGAPRGELAETFVGTILDHLGRPVGGGRLCALPHLPAELDLYEYKVDDKGVFRMPMKAGTIDPDRVGRTTSYIRFVMTDGGVTTLTIDCAKGTETFRLQEPAIVEGRVIDKASRQPIAGCRVFSQSIDSPDRKSRFGSYSNTRTDSQGKFRLLFYSRGQDNIIFQSPRNDLVAKAFDSYENQPGKHWLGEVEMSPGAVIEGQLVDAKTNAPVAVPPNKTAAISAYGPQTPKSGAAIRSAKVDAQGRFTLRLAEGTSWVYLCDRRHYSSEYASPTLAIDLKEGETRKLTIPVEERSSSTPWKAP